MDVWVVRAGQGGRHADAFEAQGIVAVAIERVPSVAGLSREEIAGSAVARADVNVARSRGHAAMLYRFANEMQPDDLVLTPDAEDANVLVGRVVGDYEYREDEAISGHHHVRRVIWLGRIARGDFPKQARQAIGAPMAVFKPGAQAALAQAVGKVIDMPMTKRVI
jgi:restriction system protein